MRKKVGAPIKYTEPLDARITILAPKKFKAEYYSLIPEGYASEHILKVLKADCEKLKNK